MKAKIIFKIAGILGVVLLLAGLFNAGVQLQTQTQLQKTTVYIAARDIEPRTLITENDLLEISFPKNYLLSGICTTKEEILGKYTEIQGMIPAGSFFYSSMLFDAESLPDYPTTLLREGQSAFTLETSQISSGGAIEEGQRVDLYASVLQQASSVTGCLIKNARIISILDAKGLRLKDPNSTGIAHIVILAVNSEDLAVITAMDNIGELRIFVSNESYDTGSEAELQTDCPVLSLLEQ